MAAQQPHNYYRTNAVLEALAAGPSGNLVWSTGNSWILVYAQPNGRPVALVFVRGESTTNDDVEGYARQLAERAHLQFLDISFDDTAATIESVQIRQASGNDVTTSLADLKLRFAELGLPVSTGTVSKAVNDKTSSAYHDWQRNNLGAIRVTDLDLLRVINAEIVEIVELKRSFSNLDQWQPYKVDYPNFNAIANLCVLSGVRFTIAYNVRTKNPLHDDPSRLSLFSYQPNAPVALGVFSFERFVTGTY